MTYGASYPSVYLPDFPSFPASVNVHTVDGRNPAPPKKPWNDDSLVNTNQQWFPMVSKWCRISSIHRTFSLVVLDSSTCLTCPSRPLYDSRPEHLAGQRMTFGEIQGLPLRCRSPQSTDITIPQITHSRLRKSCPQALLRLASTDPRHEGSYVRLLGKQATLARARPSTNNMKSGAALRLQQSARKPLHD